MPELVRLSEPDLRQTWGGGLYKRAVKCLDSGKVIERVAYRNGVIAGRWSGAGWPMLAFEDEDGIAFDCMCNTLRYPACDHAAALYLAWVRQPDTFTRLDEDRDPEAFDETGREDEFDDDYDEFEDEYEDEIALPGAATGLIPKGRLYGGPGRVVEAVTTALTAAMPDMQADYLSLLGNLTVPQLRALAERRGVALTGNRRDPMLETLAAALGRPDSLAEVWPTLSAPARLILGLLPFVTTQTGVSMQYLRQVMPQVNSSAARNLEAGIEELKSAGLLFDGSAGFFASPRNLLYWLPPDAEFVRPLAHAGGLRVVTAPEPLAFPQFVIRLVLAMKSADTRLRLRPAPARHPIEQKVPELGGWPYVPQELDGLANLRWNYHTLYSQAFTVPPAPLLLDDDSLKTLTPGLNSQPDRVDFALRLLAKLGIVAVNPGQPPAVLEDGFIQFLSQHPIEQIVPLYNAWTSLRDWTELDSVRARQPDLRLKRSGFLYGFTYPQLIAALVASRILLIQQVRRAPAGQWIDLEALVTRGHALNIPNGLWPAINGVWLEWKGQRLNLDKRNDWQLFYTRLVETTLTGPLHWLGVIDLGYRKDKLAAFRLTELGAFLMYQTREYKAPPIALSEGSLKFAPDGRLVVQPAAASPQVLSLLSLLGEARAGPPASLEFHVTASGASRAFEAGWDAERILAELRKAASTPAPAPLAKSLRDWWAHFGEAHIYADLALMELADDFALTELLASTSLSQHLLYRFSPRLIALRPEGVEILRAELVNKGYTPKVSRDQRSPMTDH